MNVVQNLPRKDYRPRHCENGINNLLARERWHQHKAARIGWIGCLVAAIVLAILFVHATHADMVTVIYPQPATDPALGYDWLPIVWYGMLIAGAAILLLAFVIWQCGISLPIILAHHDSPEDRLGDNWNHFNQTK